ncbi:Twin-arginine leader-binding protein DmsD [Leclercia adecarboxylata]|uniref:Twin-arginine leader-binding protein DmsD n=1 Tax=Leclercia adecarboxylata TaxID=83655 RepID=A0A4U9HYJ8_9ENTR|nr:Twin-arginine leader-binding protein DmsD [Leclercia adecarboxylata]
MNEGFAFTARVLGALFYFAPDSEQAAPLVAALTGGDWQQDWPLPSGQLAPVAEILRQPSDEALPDAWQRLFIGPWALPAPPWGIGLAGSRERTVWRLHSGTAPVDARQRHRL